MATEPGTTSGLPRTRDILTLLITSIVAPAERSSNPLLSTTTQTKDALLTLHTLFPNELLPALDLLDRSLVTRFRTKPRHDQSTQRGHHSKDPDADGGVGDDGDLYAPSSASSIEVYYVTSSQQASSHPRSKYRGENPVYYEVRLQAWSCSCPAFAFAAFPAILSDEPGSHVEHEAPARIDGGKYGWRFGGLAKGEDALVCKHLLACVLVKYCAAFKHFVVEREISVEEMAGWAAGWGD